MFVGGEGDTTGLKDTQLVDLSSTKTCGNLADYPLGIHDATGALVSGKPVICGGESGNHSHNFYHKECYLYNKSSNTWNFLTNMTKEKSQIASVPFKGELFVTGGINADLGSLSTTEFISLEGKVRPGPDLPSPRDSHCMVVLPEGKVMIIGGGTKEQRKTVMMFEPDSHERFDKSIPSLTNEAYDAGCAVFKSAMHNYRPVVLSVGGQEGSFAEVYDYTKSNSTWIESKIHIKKVQIILGLFLVIVMYCQASSSRINQSLNLPLC